MVRATYARAEVNKNSTASAGNSCPSRIRSSPLCGISNTHMPMLEASSAPDSWAAQYGKKSARGIRPRISAAAVTAGLKCAPETCAPPETIATSTALTATGASGLLLAATPRNVNTRRRCRPARRGMRARPWFAAVAAMDGTLLPISEVNRDRCVTDGCLLYTSDAADDLLCVDLGGRR